MRDVVSLQGNYCTMNKGNNPVLFGEKIPGDQRQKIFLPG